MVSLPKPILNIIGTLIPDNSENLFTKDQAYYVDNTKLGLYPCKTCKYYVPNEENSEEGTCTKVSGEIKANGTCSAWNATIVRLKYLEKAYGRGEEKTGVAPQIIRSKIISKVRELSKEDGY